MRQDNEEVETDEQTTSDESNDNAPKLKSMKQAEEEIVFFESFEGGDEMVVDESMRPIQRNFDFLEDPSSQMTWGRRIALSLMDYTWYNPRAVASSAEPPIEEDNVPSETIQNNRQTSDETESLLENESNEVQKGPTPKDQMPADGYPFFVSTTESTSLARAWACTLQYLCRRLKSQYQCCSLVCLAIFSICYRF